MIGHLEDWGLEREQAEWAVKNRGVDPHRDLHSGGGGGFLRRRRSGSCCFAVGFLVSCFLFDTHVGGRRNGGLRLHPRLLLPAHGSRALHCRPRQPPKSQSFFFFFWRVKEVFIFEGKKGRVGRERDGEALPEEQETGNEDQKEKTINASNFGW